MVHKRFILFVRVTEVNELVWVTVMRSEVLFDLCNCKAYKKKRKKRKMVKASVIHFHVEP